MLALSGNAAAGDSCQRRRQLLYMNFAPLRVTEMMKSVRRRADHPQPPTMIELYDADDAVLCCQPQHDPGSGMSSYDSSTASS
jgi:hypothetical protein